MQPPAPGKDRSAPARPVAVRQASVRPAPGMPAAAEEIDDEGFPRLTRQRFDDPVPRPWWRPASTFGRVVLALAALIIVGGFTTCVLLLTRYLEHDPRFCIAGSGNIQATGLAVVTRADLLPVFGEDIGRNIFFVPLAERRRQLEQIPWIEHATVMRFLPDQIRVEIVERQPVAFVRNGQQIGLVDAEGVLLSMPASMMTKHHYSFPVLTGIDPRDSQAGRRARMAVYTRLMVELDSGGQKRSEEISEIDLTNPEDARVLMPEPGTDILAHFGDERFLERYKRYKANIAEWRQEHPNLAAVDLRYDSQVVLKMSPESAASSSLAAAPGLEAAKGSAPVEAGGDAKPSPARAASRSPEKKKPAAKPAKNHPEPKHAAKPKPHPTGSAEQ